MAGSADLGITKTDGVATYTPGATTTYTITASNAGPSAANPASVTDTFPAACTSVSYTSVAAGGVTGNTAAGSGNINDLALSLPVGASVTYTAICNIAAAASGNLDNTADVASATSDPNSANNSATDSDTLVGSADLAITKTDGGATATPGGTTTYTLTASNAGPSPANPASVTDSFPAACTSVSYTSVAAGGATGNTAGPASGDINDTTLSLPVGSSITYTAICSIAAAASGNLDNSADVASATSDPTLANNSATDSDTLAGSADLSIATVLTTAPPIFVNSDVVFALTVTNNGPSNATGVVVTDTLPPGLASLAGVLKTLPSGHGSANLKGPTNDTLPTLNVISNDCGAGFASPTLTWNVGGLAAGASATCNLTVTVTQTGAITNSASVSGNESDPTSSNDSDSVTVNAQSGGGTITNPVPTLGGIGLAVLIASLSGIAALALRRRK
ncbi:MAG: hypothetical protein ACRER2_12775 [Methylococcales bacterium]